MNGLIRRQDAIDAVHKEFDEVCVWDESGQTTANEVENILYEVPSVEPERKWIPVTERLPKKENKSYWVCTDTKYQCECRWTNNIYGIGESNDWGWKIFDIPQYTKVIAWMPLPSSYQGE